jgi:CII-binding regulator of phage lambda lysogenization HflD
MLERGNLRLQGSHYDVAMLNVEHGHNNVYAPVLSDTNMAFCEICVTVISSLHSRIRICGISEILLDAELNTAYWNFTN